MTAARTTLCIFLILAVLPVCVLAENGESPVIEDEAPASLLDIDIGSEYVDLLILGSWEALLTAGLGWRTDPGTLW